MSPNSCGLKVCNTNSRDPHFSMFQVAADPVLQWISFPIFSPPSVMTAIRTGMVSCIGSNTETMVKEIF